MKASTLQTIDKGKHGLYLFSIGVLFFLTALAFLHAPASTIHMDFLAAVMPRWALTLLVLALAVVLAFVLLFFYQKLISLPEKTQTLVVGILAALGILLQYALLFTFRATLRYDHLKVFDEALEIFRTGEISMTYGEAYFAQYPFNIPITLFNYLVLNIAKLIGIPESGYMLTIQCVYLAGTDLAVFFSYRILRMLRSRNTATLFALLCIINPLMYMYGFACYTTILMLPFLMGNLLLFFTMLKEKRPKRKIIYAFLLGVAFILGTKIRANLLITLITFAGYLIIHVRNADTFVEKKKQVVFLLLATLIGGGLCYSACMSAEHKYVKGDYTDTQLPPSYYFLFSSKLDSLGSYNEEDHVFIQGFETEEEKNNAAWHALFARLAENGLSGNAFLADYKLSFTWSDGIDDYPEFLHTTDVYGTLHDFLAGSRKDLFALYCHVYHVMTMAALVYAVFLAFRRKCDTPFYCVYLNLLGAMLFHLMWEAGWAYSISFTMLVLLLAAEGMDCFSGKMAESIHQSVDSSQADGTFRSDSVSDGTISSGASSRYWRILACGALVITLGISVIYGRSLFTVPFKQMEYAVMQDMSDGEDLQELLTGEVITQTFTTSRSFNHIGCKVLNPLGDANPSSYRIEVLDSDGNVLGSRDLGGSEVLNKDYAYVKFDTVVPVGEETYTIRVTGLSAEPGSALTFLYYNSGNWDIYPEGKMTGLNSGEMSDLTFVVYDSVTKCFFN